MLNQIVIAGRLTDNPTIEELEDGKKFCKIVVAVPRSFKNADGTYDTDFIECVLYNSIAETTTEYCHKGDVVGIKGRIQTDIVDDKKTMIIIAEKVSFLSSKRNEEE